MISTTAGTAVVWNLDATDEAVINESIDGGPYKFLANEPHETALTIDRRKRVEKRHYASGGKNRGVLKIHTKFDKNDTSWWSGTGWLLEDDLVVTAGHNVYHHNSGRRAVYLNTYAGYNGLGSVGKYDVQKRQGKQVVVSRAYYKDQVRACDAALVRLKEPFKNIKPFKYRETPELGYAFLGVVGYPADKDTDHGPGDLGPYMYEDFAQTSWDLRRSGSRLLQYRISTYGGQSGSPVIDMAAFHCIGTHIQGFAPKTLPFNSASPIGGQHGNSYKALARVIKDQSSSKSSSPWRVSLHSPSLEMLVHEPTPLYFKEGGENANATHESHDTLFLVDDSESMMNDGGIRWETAKRAIGEIASIVTTSSNSNGVEVQFFNHFQGFKNLKTVDEVLSLFKDIKPGPSRTADKLEDVLRQYCSEFKANKDIKGLNLIVLTDGDPSDGQDVEDLIVDIARELKDLSAPSLKVGIQFVQIGNDPKASAFLRRLDDQLQGPYELDRDMVDTVPWVEGSGETLHQKILYGGIIKRFDNDATQLR